jgi:hypothetical protein
MYKFIIKVVKLFLKKEMAEMLVQEERQYKKQRIYKDYNKYKAYKIA